MKGLLLSMVAVLALLLVMAQAGPGGQVPTVTYTISLQEDGSAIWIMEYRTPLLSEGDLESFGNYSEQIQGAYLQDYTELMKRSAAEASIVTGRPVSVGDFSADAAVQSGPTGSYGVVHYRCLWSGFATTGESLNVGDVFVGGLYLGKDHALIIRPPTGFAVAEAFPPSDRTQDGLVWYGLRSFGAGEPRIVLMREPLPWLPVILLAAMAGLAIVAYTLRRGFFPAPPAPVGGPAPEPLDPVTALALDERILALLREKGGSLFQSEIVDGLALPKSTVSEAINRLREAGRIEKVRKGRENLIRLV
jgi:DNA-binding transcriptional ArsR family regulator